MSSNPLQPGVLSHYASLQTATTLMHSFCNLSVEVRVMILCIMTVAELINFRCCCMAFNALFIANESPIIRGILKNHNYHTASTLYGTVSALGPLKFKSLKDIARRCHIVEMLATSITEYYVGQDLATTIRMGRNIRPYLLSLGHFYEKYRKGLANYINNPLYEPSFRLPGTRVEGEILKANYNEQTVQRICLTYKLLNQIIDEKFFGRKPSIWQQLPYRIFSSAAVPADMFTFGGLEMVKDIVTRPRLSDRLKYTASHFAKTTPVPIPVVSGESFAVALPPSVLGPRLGITTTRKICDLFPITRPILQVCDIKFFGFSKIEPAEELDMDRDFLEYLKSYDGDEPKLVF